MSTFGDLERAFASLYEYRWFIGAGVMVCMAAFLAFGYWKRWHLFLWRHRLPVGVISAPLLVLTLWLGWSLGSPLFTNVTVEEEFPYAFTATVPETMEREDIEQAMSEIAELDDTVMEAMPSASTMALESAVMEAMGMMEEAEENEDTAMMDKGMTMMQEALDNVVEAAGEEALDNAVEAVGEEAPDNAVEAVGEEAPDNADEAAEEEAPPIRVKTGEFKDADAFHKGSGQATIYQGPDGSHLLRLENLDVTNGPRLHVYLSGHEDPGDPEEVREQGYYDLGRSKGNRGNQNYPLPSDVDVTAYNSVVIYCQPFHVVFSVASLTDAG